MKLSFQLLFRFILVCYQHVSNKLSSDFICKIIHDLSSVSGEFIDLFLQCNSSNLYDKNSNNTTINQSAKQIPSVQ